MNDDSTTTVSAKSFRCSSCGAPLKIPKNSKGRVQCPSCRNECVIEGLAKNAEIVAKENINSGFPLFASPAVLHRKLLSCLAEAPNFPADVFEQVEVIKEEHYCVPAYCFYCNGTASFTYQAGNVRQQTVVRDDGKSSWEETRSRMEWSQMSGSASVSHTLFAPGEKKFSPLIKQLYMKRDPSQLSGQLVDIEELEFQPDVLTLGYNLPQPAAFNEHVKPLVDVLLEQQAKNTLAGMEVRNMSMGGSNIQKDVVRVFLGLYRVVFTYGGTEYSVWMTGDGEDAFSERLPEDTQQKTAVDAKNQAMEQEVSSVSVPTTTMYTLGLWACLIGGVVLAFAIGNVIPAIVGIIAAIVFKVLKGKIMNPYNARCADIRAKFQKEISDLEARSKNALQQFKSQKKAFRGIYADVSGDSSAF